MMRRPSILLFLALCCSLTLAQAQHSDTFAQRLDAAAIARAKVHVRYVSDYVRLSYPGGDVPADTGVCTDEIIRIYRAVGVDLQKEVHEDMARHLAEYPLHGRTADANIDHRRVPNLGKFFERNGAALKITRAAGDYQPGDVVTWDLDGKHTHVGMVVSRTNLWGRHEVLHNIGEGPKIEDVLFDWKITGHYRYYGPRS
jgi:uncharacterized protein YijF (DUF1287 family)